MRARGCSSGGRWMVCRGLAGILPFLFAVPLGAELWRSPLHGLTYVQVEKRLRDVGLDAEQTLPLPPEQVYEPLPAEVADLLGPYGIDYAGAVSTYLPAAEAVALMERATTAGLLYEEGIDRQVELPWHTFTAGDADGRHDRAWEGLLAPSVVPGLYLLQFAYPIREEWIPKLEHCSAQRIAFFQQRTLLVRAAGLASLVDCPLTPYISWIDARHHTDRMDPALLAESGARSFVLQYMSGTDLPAKVTTLHPLAASVAVAAVPVDLGAYLEIAVPADLTSLAANDPDLLSVSLQGEAMVSDERQGQIVAGNHNGIGPSGPGYRAWLQSRGLLTPSNQPIVGIVDSGYDNGDSVNHHPDLKNPERLLALARFPGRGSGFLGDALGHGTMVAGIIAGDGITGTGATDSGGYRLGSGIVPTARLAVAKVERFDRLDVFQSALDFCRNDPTTGQDRAQTVNFSFNLFARQPDNTQLPLNKYDQFAKFFDSRVLDGNAALAGDQRTTIVFSAGNHAYAYATGAIRMDSVGSPATAKNVITVGATASYRPAPNPPLDCRPQSDGGRPPNQDATHIAEIGLFSGRGRAFSGGGPDKLHRVRIKPDLVAPGVRVFSTVPYNFPHYLSPVGCARLWPVSSTTFHTYGTGTSFAAPVVTGIAALARKQFLDQGTNPSPSLVKAALIATADSIGGQFGNDHRPSPHSGWGRVNLNRLSDSRPRFVRDNPAVPVATGESRTWTRTIDNPAFDTYIVLAWTDPPAEVLGHSQAPLLNNLRLSIEEVNSNNRFWRGNNFRENLTGADNGYSFRFRQASDVQPVVDTINNVEAVFIPANTFPAGQQVTIRVFGESVTTGTQRFSVFGYNVRPNS